MMSIVEQWSVINNHGLAAAGNSSFTRRSERALPIDSDLYTVFERNSRRVIGSLAYGRGRGQRHGNGSEKERTGGIHAQHRSTTVDGALWLASADHAEGSNKDTSSTLATRAGSKID
jgi:hypothetical protein